jgi:creatinine amidohydrolase/Fe(II)-dependent formamide hydrolase-like protein
MEWHGPLFCLQNDERTIESAIAEAVSLMTPGQIAWVVGYVKNPSHTAFRFTIGEGPLDVAELTLIIEGLSA